MSASLYMQAPSMFRNGIQKIREFDKVMATESLNTTLNRLSKWIALATFIIVMVCRHDAKALWIAMGSVINVVLSAKLKATFNLKRPSASLRSDPGMPSSHSQSIFFVATFTILSVVDRLGSNDWTLFICGAILAFSSYLAWLRVITNQHTKSQVMAGAVVGFLFCSFWVHIWSAVVLHAYNTSLLIRIAVIMETAGFWAWFVLVVLRKRVLGPKTIKKTNTGKWGYRREASIGPSTNKKTKIGK